MDHTSFRPSPQTWTTSKPIMPYLYNIYQICVEKDKDYQDKFEQTHNVLTTSKPAMLGSYTIRLLGKKYFERKENMSMIFLLKVLMCPKVNQAHQELWPLFSGGTYAGCKAGQVETTCPRNSIYLFSDEKKSHHKFPLSVDSCLQVMNAF